MSDTCKDYHHHQKVYTQQSNNHRVARWSSSVVKQCSKKIPHPKKQQQNIPHLLLPQLQCTKAKPVSPHRNTSAKKTELLSCQENHQSSTTLPIILSALSRHKDTVNRIPSPISTPPQVKLRFLVGPEKTMFVIPKSLIIQSKSRMLIHWIKCGQKAFMEQQTQCLHLSTIDVHLFTIVCDWLLYSYTCTTTHTDDYFKSHRINPDLLLELAMAAHYLDLHLLVDQCLDVCAVHYAFEIQGFLGFPLILIRSLLKRIKDPLALHYCEHILARESIHMHLSTLWTSHLFRLRMSPDLIYWPACLMDVPVQVLRDLCLAHYPIPLKHVSSKKSSSSQNAILLNPILDSATVTKVFRVAQMKNQHIHFRLIESAWLSPPIGHVSTQHEAELAQPPSLTHDPNLLLVQGQRLQWSIKSVPTTWHIQQLTLYNCHLSGRSLESLCNWISQSQSLQHLSIIQAQLVLCLMEKIISACTCGSAMTRIVFDALNASHKTPATLQTTSSFIESLKLCQHPMYIHFRNFDLPPSTLGAILAAWPTNALGLSIDNMHISPVLVPKSIFPNLKSITELSLKRNGLVASTLIDLIYQIRAHVPNLNKLDISQNQITNAVVLCLAECLPSLSHITYINLDLIHLDETGLDVHVTENAWIPFFEVWQLSTFQQLKSTGLTLSLKFHLVIEAPVSFYSSADLRACLFSILSLGVPLCLILSPELSHSNLQWWQSCIKKISTHPVTIWTHPILSSSRLIH